MKIARLTISNFRGIKSAEFHFDGHALMIVDSEKQRNGQGCLEATILADPVAILKTFCPNCWMNFSRIVINSSRSRPRNMSVVDDLGIDDGTAQKQLARAYVMSLLRNEVLRSDMGVAQPPLQR